MDAFGEGLLAGYGIAIPVGAIAILIVNTAMQRGFRIGFMAGAGAASADLLFALLAAIGGQALATALTPLAPALRILSALVLVSLGVFGLWKLRQATAAGATPVLAAASGARTYSQFFGLTLLNPLTVAYFAALILGRGAALSFSPEQRLLFVLGAAVSSLSWQTQLAVIGALARRHLLPGFRLATTVIGNLVIIALGLRLVF